MHQHCALGLRGGLYLLPALLISAPNHVSAATRYSSLTSGTNHSCVLIDEVDLRHVACWGHNSRGQLGNQSGDPNHDYSQALPEAVAGLAGYPTQLSAGDAFTCALLISGSVQCWGDNFQGALGRYDWFISNPWPTAHSTSQPLSIGNFGAGHRAVQISAGGAHACALDTEGSVYCWGDNRNFELGTTNQGLGNWGFLPTPQQIALPYKATAITSGTDFSCALLTGPTLPQWNIQLPEVRCWGNDSHAELGDGSAVGGNKVTPVLVQGLKLFPTAISAGTQGACALDDLGDEQCWGDGLDGEIGSGKSYQATNGLSLTADAVVGGPYNVLMTGGDRDNFNCSALSSHGGLACWGNNYWNQLTSRCQSGSTCNSPIMATLFAANVIWPDSAPATPTEISGGIGHTCAIATLLDAPHVYCWGHNDYGQVGNGDTSYSYWFSIVPDPELIL